MRVKTTVAAIAALSSAFALAACMPPPTTAVENPKPAPTAASALASYDLGDSRFTEFRSVSDPGKIVIAFDGYQSSGISTWKADGDIKVGEPQVLAKYSNDSGNFYEFRPATNKNITCTYVDAYKSGSLTCG